MKIIPKLQTGYKLYDDAQLHIGDDGLAYAIRDNKIEGTNASVWLPNVNVTLNRNNSFADDSQSVANLFAKEVVQPTLDAMGTAYHYTLGQVPLIGPFSEKAGTVLSIPQMAGFVRSGKAPWSPNNRGFGEYTSIENPETWNTYTNLSSIFLGGDMVGSVASKVPTVSKYVVNFKKNKGWAFPINYYRAKHSSYNRFPLKYWSKFRENPGKNTYIRKVYYDDDSFAGWSPSYLDKTTKDIIVDFDVLFKPTSDFIETHLSTGDKPTQFGKRVYAKFLQGMPEGTYFGSNPKAMSSVRNILQNGAKAELKRLVSEHKALNSREYYSPDSYMQLLEESKKGRIYKDYAYNSRNMFEEEFNSTPITSELGKQLSSLVKEAEQTGSLINLNKFLKEHGADEARFENGKVSLPEYVIRKKNRKK